MHIIINVQNNRMKKSVI